MALRASLAVDADPAAVTFGLVATNEGTDPVSLSFPTGQTVEVEVYPADGDGDSGAERDGGRPAGADTESGDDAVEPVWRYGEGRMFTQAVRDATLAPGEALQFDATWESPAPGTYRAVAYTTAAPAARAEQTFTIGE
ncbi:MAG: BsuPI-related putative proteinase inhibitor [Halobacteriaceae archaeon]